jgi:protein-S-isoprenylcysteine O-methyltransferase Ste14
MQWLELKVPPPVVGVLVAAGMWLLAPVPPELPLLPLLRLPLVAVLALAGLAFDAAGLLVFRRNATTVNPLRPERASALVTTGAYRVTRNPMYTGMALLLAAWAVYLSAAWPLLGPLAFVAYIGRFQIAPEERALAARFGDAYAAYVARVRRWL